jgi:flagellar motility protein MotE (MotC chaperone)
MSEAIGWTAVIMAVVAMVRGEWSAMTARRAAHEKAETDRMAARDKLEFDAKIQHLEAHNRMLAEDHSTCAETTKALKDDVARCKDQHMESERNQAELRGRLAVLEKFLTARPGA